MDIAHDANRPARGTFHRRSRASAATVALTLCFLLPILAGCASINARSSPVAEDRPRHFYPGTTADLGLMADAVFGSGEGQGWAIFFFPVALIDLPLSLGLDTLLLPYDLCMLTFGGKNRAGIKVTPDRYSSPPRQQPATQPDAE